MHQPARHLVISPNGKTGSIKLRSLAGDGVYLTTVHGYTAKIPSGGRMPKEAALIAVEMAKFAPALSPTMMIFSPVDPSKGTT